MTAMMSPCCAPLSPALPLPFTRRLCPVSMPSGTLMVIFRGLRTLPGPPHSAQGSVIISPPPWHLRHVDCVCIVPKNVLRVCLSSPVPLHTSHCFFPDLDVVPSPLHVGHSVIMSKSKSFFAPNAASST